MYLELSHQTNTTIYSYTVTKNNLNLSIREEIDYFWDSVYGFSDHLSSQPIVKATQVVGREGGRVSSCVLQAVRPIWALDLPPSHQHF